MQVSEVMCVDEIIVGSIDRFNFVNLSSFLCERKYNIQAINFVAIFCGALMRLRISYGHFICAGFRWVC